MLTPGATVLAGLAFTGLGALMLYNAKNYARQWVQSRDRFAITRWIWGGVRENHLAIQYRVGGGLAVLLGLVITAAAARLLFQGS